MDTAGHSQTVILTTAWIRDTIEAMIDSQDSLKITTETTEGGTHFVVLIPQGDIGKVIGKQGRTARAMRTMLQARAGKDQTRYSIDLQELGAECPECFATLPHPGDSTCSRNWPLNRGQVKDRACDEGRR